MDKKNTAGNSEAYLTARRLMLGQRLRKTFGNVVSYGPLKGFRMAETQTWGHSADVGVQLVGFYEKEVLDAVCGGGRRYRCLVNLGAGDGYYGVGLVKAGIAQRSICFESNPESRAAITACADLNGVADHVAVLETADHDFLDRIGLQDEDLGECLFIIDIEGGEFGLLDGVNLQRLRRAEMIVELHGFVIADDPGIEQRFLARLGDVFDCSMLMTGARDPSRIAEMASWNDSDRWLSCSEGRPCLMRWVHCQPHVGQQ
jgi:hypothetical protein